MELKVGMKFRLKEDIETLRTNIFFKGEIGELVEIIDDGKSVIYCFKFERERKFITKQNPIKYVEWIKEKTDPIVESVITTPSHYDNSKGTLYKVALERGWNAYLFDIVKRLERAEKKGVFDEDLDKSIAVIQLWKKERNNK